MAELEINGPDCVPGNTSTVATKDQRSAAPDVSTPSRPTTNSTNTQDLTRYVTQKMHPMRKRPFTSASPRNQSFERKRERGLRRNAGSTSSTFASPEFQSISAHHHVRKSSRKWFWTLGIPPRLFAPYQVFPKDVSQCPGGLFRS
jgi:hypothetical protein